MSPDFVPKRRLISNVTNAFQAVVTTTEAHGYETGLIVRLFVPRAYGMDLFNQGTVTRLDDTSFSVDIDTSNQSPFVEPTYPPIQFTQAQVIPISGVTDNIAT